MKIIFTGVEENSAVDKTLGQQYQAGRFDSGALQANALHEADVVVVGPAQVNPVQLVQKIYALDKQVSVLLLVPATQVVAIKQVLRFAPFIGNNVTVVTLHPETELKTIIESAASRTRQKRSFNKLKGPSTSISLLTFSERLKLEQLGSFMEHAPIAALVVNEEQQIVHYNKKAKDIFSDRPSGRNILADLFPLPEVERINQFIKVGEKGSSLFATAKKKHFEITTTELAGEEGNSFFLLILNDITLQQQETQRIQRILEALPQMAWTAKANGEVDFYTRGWYNYTGQNEASAMGHGWEAVVHPEDVEKAVQQWQNAISSGNTFQHAARYRHASGYYRWHLVRATPLRDVNNAVTMWVGTCTDIHDQILLTEELERKVKERTQVLEQTNAELEQFAHISSHDLQEPLRKIRTFSDMILNKEKEILGGKTQELVLKINTTAERMSRFLNDLLNFTQLNENKPFAPVDLEQVVDHVLTDLELLIQQKEATIHRQKLPEITAVGFQMQLLFYNLINNALKFSKPGQKPLINISCEMLQQDQREQFQQLQPFINYYYIIISDNGIGFEQQYAEKIFSIFQRLHNKNDYAGTGIGLSLVKKVVTKHKGEIIATASPGNGASFHLALPARDGIRK